jgi:hypothetical protein
MAYKKKYGSNIPTQTEKVNGMPGATRERTEGGAVTPPQRPKSPEYDANGKKIGTQVPRYPLPQTAQVTKRTIGGQDVTNMSQQDRETLAGKNKAVALETEKMLVTAAAQKQATDTLIQEDIAKQQGANPLQAQASPVQDLPMSMAEQNVPPTALPPQAEAVSEEDDRSKFMQLFMPTAQEGAQRRLDTFGTTAKWPAVLAAAAAGAAVYFGGTALSAAAYGQLAKESGWRSVNAAIRYGWQPSVSALAKVVAINLAKAVVSKKLISLAAGGSAGLYIVRSVSGDAKQVLSLSTTDMNLQIEKVKNGEMSYENALRVFEEDIGNINSARNSIKYLTRIKPLAFITGTKELQVQFENAERELPFKRAALLQAARESQVNAAKMRLGI